MKIPEKTKKKIKEMYENGKSLLEISKELNVPYSTVQYYAKPEYRENMLNNSKEYSREHPRKNSEKRREYMRNYMREYNKRKKK